ncbi:MAG: TspO/MBR family protein [Pseudomonadota bacterium]
MAGARTSAPPWGMGALIAVHTAAVALLFMFAVGDPWQASLVKPPLAPSDLLSRLVWPGLFVLMAAGAVLVRAGASSFEDASGVLGLYFFQLLLALAWSWVFFEFRRPAAALTLLAAWAATLSLLMRDSRGYSDVASWLFAPALVWALLAGYVNLGVLTLN